MLEESSSRTSETPHFQKEQRLRDLVTRLLKIVRQIVVEYVMLLWSYVEQDYKRLAAFLEPLLSTQTES